MSRHPPELAGHVASTRSRQMLVAALLLTALALALAACAPGGAPAAPAAPTSAPAAQPTAVPPTAAPAPTATSAPKPTDKPTAAATEAPKAAPTEKPTATVNQTPTQAPPTQAAAAAQPAAVSFAKDVKPILDQKCLKCHGGEKTNASLSFKSYADLMKGSENGPVVVAGKADESEMIKLVTSGEMPKRNPRLPAAEVKILQDWVNGGAQNN